MTRTLSTLFALFIFLIVNSQNLTNTEWIKVKAQRKDGSKIVNEIEANAAFSLYFFDDSVFVGLSHQYAYKQNYSIKNNILSIGERQDIRLILLMMFFCLFLKHPKRIYVRMF